jgi:hypothetical protein
MEWRDLRGGLSAYFELVKATFKTLMRLSGGVIFYCKRGRHRSSCVLAMFFLFLYPNEDPEQVMAFIKTKRPEVEFFEVAGRYPPLAKIVREWHEYIRKGPLHYVVSDSTQASP